MNRIVNNAAWIIAGKIAQNLLGFVISMLSARYLGPSNYGLINYAISIVTFVSPFVMMGVDSVLVQSLVTEPENEGKILGTSMAMCAVTAVLGMIASATFVFIFNAGETETILVVILYSTILLTRALELIQYWYQAKLLSKYYSIVSLIAYVLVSAYKIYLLVAQKSAYWFALSYSLDSLLIGVMLVFCYRKLKGQRFGLSVSTARALVRKGKYYILPSLMISLCTQTDKIMLREMVGETETGFYSAAMVCVGLTSFIFSAITESFRSVILENKGKDGGAYERQIKTLYSIEIYLALAQAVAFMLFGKLVIGLFYGEDYAPAASMLQILAWYTACSSIGVVRNIWILAEGKQQYLLGISLAGAIINLVLNSFLIPVSGGDGAALASLLAQFTMNVVMTFAIKPIRPSFWLMIQSLNPRILWNMLKQMKENRT